MTFAPRSAAIIIGAFMVAPAFAEETRELGAHEHGAATLEVAVEGDAIEMMLEVPAENIVGFEHSPETDEQKAAIEEATEQLSDPLALFSVPGEAGCEVTSSEVEVHQEGDHMGFEGAYALRCADVAAIDAIDTQLFNLYPTIEEIDVSYATAAGQGAAELEADSSVLELSSAQ